MAKFSPNILKIKNEIRPRPQAGEIFLLEKIEKDLNDDWNVYFQPCLDNVHPDIILVCKNFGVFIIEVKDWIHDSYYIRGQNGRDIWQLKNKDQHIYSPIDQTDNYLYKLKENLKTHLNEKEFNDIKSNIIGITYFHNFSKDEVAELSKLSEKVYKYNIKLLNRIIINQEDLLSIFNRYIIRQSNVKFNDYIIEKINYILKPSLNWLDTMFPKEKFHFNKKQLALSESKDEHIKFRGVAGSGKTFVLAKRAIEAFKRKEKKVLILYYNITIKNYFHDRISAFRENISWDAFEIMHFHSLLYHKLKKEFDINEKNLTETRLIEKIKERMKNQPYEKYATILIDEGQDFHIEWFNFIKDFLLEENGEYVICADEKQNVYKNELDDNKVRTNILGRWNELNESYRLSGNIKEVVKNFQKKYFHLEDVIDEGHFKMSLFDPEINYYRVNNDQISSKIIQLIDLIRSKGIKDNDICIISETYNLLDKISTKLDEKNYKHYYVIDNPSIKNNLHLNNNLIKLVTIKSFKGWESNSVILVLDDEISSEILYTGMTRAFSNLYIVNSNYKYENFFHEQQRLELLKVNENNLNDYEDIDLPF